MKTIPASEPLDKYVRQNGVLPGVHKLDVFRLALTLRGTPPLRSQEWVPDPTVYVKIFDPMSNWTFFVLEWDGKDDVFGLSTGMEAEFGYASLVELADVQGALGIGLEVDVWFLPAPVSQIRRGPK